MAASPQCLQRPSDFALSSFSLCWVCRLSFLASGVSGCLLWAGSFGAVCFLDLPDLVSFALESGFGFLPARLAKWKVSIRSCGFTYASPLPQERGRIEDPKGPVRWSNSLSAAAPSGKQAPSRWRGRWSRPWVSQVGCRTPARLRPRRHRNRLSAPGSRGMCQTPRSHRSRS